MHNKPRIRLKAGGGYKWFSNVRSNSDISLCTQFATEMGLVNNNKSNQLELALQELEEIRQRTMYGVLTK